GTSNFGTVFKVNLDGSGYAILHQFGNSNGDGRSPSEGLMPGSDGALYGTTVSGGAYADRLGNGTVFKLKLDGTGFSVLHSFAGTSAGDSEFPAARLLEGSDGALYGTTTGYCGRKIAPFSNPGVVFKVSKDGSSYNILASGPGIGALVQGWDGNLYGTIFCDGGCCGGTYSSLFKVSTDGTGYSTVSDFGGAPIAGP